MLYRVSRHWEKSYLDTRKKYDIFTCENIIFVSQSKTTYEIYLTNQRTCCKTHTRCCFRHFRALGFCKINYCFFDEQKVFFVKHFLRTWLQFSWTLQTTTSKYWLGVFQNSNKARWTSPFDSKAFFINNLHVLTFPFDWGCKVDDVECWNSHSLSNSLNSLQTNCEPLSVNTMSGIPWRLNWQLSPLWARSSRLSGSGGFPKFFEAIPQVLHTWHHVTIKQNLCSKK